MPNWAEKGHSQTFHHASDFPTEPNRAAGFSPYLMWPIVWSCGCKLEVDLTCCWTDQWKVSRAPEKEVKNFLQSDKVTNTRIIPVNVSYPLSFSQKLGAVVAFVAFPYVCSCRLQRITSALPRMRQVIWSTFVVKLIQPGKSIEFLFSRPQLRASLHFRFLHFTAPGPKIFNPHLATLSFLPH